MGEWLFVLRLFLALVLYVFLGLAFYIMWQGLREDAQETLVTPMPAQLIFEAGAREGQRFLLRPVTTVGRGSDNFIVLNDEFVSANHAMILWRDATWWLEDLESHNGTYLNGERISEPISLTDGDHIRIGGMTLRFDMLLEERE